MPSPAPTTTSRAPRGHRRLALTGLTLVALGLGTLAGVAIARGGIASGVPAALLLAAGVVGCTWILSAHLVSGQEIGRAPSEEADEGRVLRIATRFTRAAARAQDRQAVFRALQQALERLDGDRAWVPLAADAVSTVPDHELPLPRDALLAALDQGSAARDDIEVGGTLAPTIVGHLRASFDVEGFGGRGCVPLRSPGLAHGLVVQLRPTASNERLTSHVEHLCHTAVAALHGLELGRLARANEQLVSLGRLAAAVTHEMNNPLAYVMANVRTVEGDLREAGGDTFEAARDARLAAEHLARILDDISSLSRGGAALDQQIHDLGDLTRVAVKMAAARDVSVPVVISQQPGLEVLCDGGRIEQIILNLVANAIDAVGDRTDAGVEVTVGQNGAVSYVDVVDNGPGIDPGHRPRIFEPFFTTKRERGTGLGLFLARSLAGAHGGELRILSTGARGTTFRLELPSLVRPSIPPRRPSGQQRAVLPPDSTRFPSTKEESPAFPSTEGVPASTGLDSSRPDVASGHRPRRPRVLVVDDDPALLRALRRWLGRRTDVDVCGEPEEALRRIAEAPYDLVFTDLNMPAMSGVELAEAAVALRPEMAGKVALMTGEAPATAGSGGYYLVTKPIDPIELNELFGRQGFGPIVTVPPEPSRVTH